MDESSGIGKLLRDLNQAYMDGLSTISSAISELGKRRIPDAERQIERWIGVARAAKDGYVASIDQGFAMWEKQIRKMLAPDRSKTEKETKRDANTPPNQLEAWLEEWKKANESFTHSLRESGLGEEAMKQAKEFRKTFESGLKSLQKLWQSGSDETRK
ncbi:MAG: hypothetical protein JWM69_1049 [Candidatus Binatus sp.]|nr:hypothetical protein [Candidatus Binatus sp.]